MKPVDPKPVPAGARGTPPMGTAPASMRTDETALSRERKQDYAPPAPPPVSKHETESDASLRTIELESDEGSPAPDQAPSESEATASGNQNVPAATVERGPTTPVDGTPAADTGIARERVDTAPPRRKLAPAPVVVEPSAKRRTVGMVIGGVVLLAIGFALRAAVDPLLNPPGIEAKPMPPLPAAPRQPAPRGAEPTVVPALEAEADPAPDPAELPSAERDEPMDEEPPIEEGAVPRVTPQIARPRAPTPSPRAQPATNETPDVPQKTPPKARSKPTPQPPTSPRPSRSRGAIVRDTPF